MESKMKYNKFRAFTLAEVMVLLLTLSILLAAFSPVFTTRFSNYSSDDVWAYVPGDDENDAYYDTSNKTYTAQAFIGMTPANSADVALSSQDDSNNTLYSKLVIKASNAVKAGALTYPQAQMQFRYGSSTTGTLMGALFAGNKNFLVGGKYGGITNDAKYNTAFGTGALSSLKNGQNNTAIGYNALSSMTAGYNNTAVGYNAGAKITTNSMGNTIIGYNAVAGNSTINHYNTIIGNNTVGNSIGQYNTFVGNDIAATTSSTISAQYNTAIGNYALNQLTKGENNTAVGYNALANNTTGSSNTAIGINACTQVTEGSNKTCIGAYSGSTKDRNDNDVKVKKELFTGNQERIFIGGPPMQYISTISESERPAAVLEIHNVRNNNKDYKRAPIGNAPDASVVINGNLIVRGTSYFEVPIRRPQNRVGDDTAYETERYTHQIPKGLVGFSTRPSRHKGITVFAGADGMLRENASVGDCNGCRRHAYNDIRQNCICTSVTGSSTSMNTSYDKNSSNFPLSSSYDWSTAGDKSFSNGCRARNPFGSGYTDGSYNTPVTFSDDAGRGSSMNTGYHESDDNMAHRKDGSSCCPVLKSSDRRLKNVGEKFTVGLAELKKLNIYNYTFKNDANKTPHVGVIAQDLKLVFPNAVTRGANGFLQIRWDEMFYALVNAVKEINTRVTSLSSKIAKDNSRITALKKDNAQLNAQLDKLADELTEIEAKKK